MDFNFVTERVATGTAVMSPVDADTLAVLGVTHIINCCGEYDEASLVQPRFAYLWIGVGDDGQPKPVDWFQKGIEFALGALSQPKHKVYAHCGAGINRGPSMTYAILRAQGLQPRDAWNIVKTYRPQAGIAYGGDADKAVEALGY